MTATRLYFARTGTAAVTPAVFDSLWGVTSVATVTPCTTTRTNTSISNTSTSASETSAAVTDVLVKQFVSTEQVSSAHTISGTFSAVAFATEGASAADAFMQFVVKVVSADGATVRGILYAGNTATAVTSTVGDTTEEISSTGNTRIYNAIAVSPVAASVGDRIVIEMGFRACNVTTSSQFAYYYIGDPTTGTDLALTSGVNNTTNRPWLELSDDVFAVSAATYTAGASVSAAAAVTASATRVAPGAASVSATATITAAATRIPAGITAAASVSTTAATTATATVIPAPVAATVSVGAVATITAEAAVVSYVVAEISTRASNGRYRTGVAYSDLVAAVAPEPPRAVLAQARITTETLPPPTLVDGRPT